MVIKKASEPMATWRECDRLMTTITVLEMMLPTTGSNPARKVTAIMLLVNGKWTPAKGRTTNK